MVFSKGYENRIIDYTTIGIESGDEKIHENKSLKQKVAIKSTK
jgi:hypothetical protein